MARERWKSLRTKAFEVALQRHPPPPDHTAPRAGVTVWVLTYATQQHLMKKDTLLNGVLLGTAAQLFAIPFFGGLSDRFGRRLVYLAGAIFLLAMAFPFFGLVDTKSTAMVWTAIIVVMIGYAAMYGPQAAFFSELFGTRARRRTARICDSAGTERSGLPITGEDALRCP